MPGTGVPWLGGRIREERVRQGMSLRGLAREVGVSASMISQIETAKAQPSVSTLYAITSTLGISIEDLFNPPEGVPSTPAPAVAAAVPAPAVLTLDSGVTWEMLGELPRRTVDFLRITYPPGGTSSSNGGLMRHPGCEYGFVLQGELILTLGFDELHLRPGDAVCFESTTPHRYRNDGTEPAVGIWFVLEREP
jgi:transcriptional regulator with XRE-family HTH domain